MATNANIKAVITADDQASKVLKDFSNHVDNVGSKIGTALKATAVAGVAAAGAVVAFGVSSVKSFEESENSLAQLNATLKSTGGVAGVTADAAVDLANAMQRVTKYSDEEVLSAENLLLTFTNISKDIFPDATKIVLDMSTALGQDLKSSSIQVGKALQDPILGVTALRRVGVNFSEKQQDVIKNLVETGRAAEAQKLILKELQTEFGGSAIAAGNTFAGKLAILKNQFDELKETIGKTLVEAITPWMQRLAEFVASDKFQQWLQTLVSWLQINLPVAINYVANTLIPNLVNIFNELWPVIQLVVEWLGKFIQFLADHEAAVWAFIGVIATMKAAFVMNSVVSAFQASMGAIGGSYQSTALLLSTPVTITIAVGAALIALALVRQSAIDTWNELDRTQRAINSMRSAKQDALDRLARIYGDPGKSQADRDRAFKQAQGLLSEKFASGTSYFGGGVATVGEQGPEQVILPRGSQVVPNNSVRDGSSSGVVSITVQAGAYMGSQQDARQYARVIADALQDIASMQGRTVQQVMGMA